MYLHFLSDAILVQFASTEQEMLRDQLVVEIRDEAMSQKFQVDAELTLEKAKKSIRQKEAVHSITVSAVLTQAGAT